MDGETDALSQARQIYERFQEERLAASPLGTMAEWIQTGHAPPAETLRSVGFRADADHGDLRIVRKAFVRAWGFSIPCSEAISALLALSPLIELGAGTGYWSALLSAAGIDVIATDPSEDQSAGYGFTAAAVSPVEHLDGVSAVRRYPDRNAFCSWPTEGDDWCAEAARALGGGKSLAIIGKDRGGSTGSDALFDLLDRDFELTQKIVIPQFPGIEDALHVYRKTTVSRR